MAVTNIKYNSVLTSITFTLNSLASSVLAGRESSTVDNSTNLYDDVELTVILKGGAAVSLGDCYVMLVPQDGTNVASPATGSDAGLTLTSDPGPLDTYRPGDPVPGTGFFFIGKVSMIAQAAATVCNKIFPIARCFGGLMPYKWSLFVLNRTGQALAASGNSAAYTGITYTTA